MCSLLKHGAVRLSDCVRIVASSMIYCLLGGAGLLEDEMRSGPPLVNHNNNTLPAKQQHDADDDDMFGAPRTYPTSFCGRPARPTMISAKYRQKEERRKVLKISINKLKKIEDPESSLRRSVLINNTMRKLQRESREEKLVKQQSFRYSYSSDLFKEDENTVDPLASAATTTATSPPRTSQSDQLVDITNLPEPHKTHGKGSDDPLGCEESMPELMDTLVASEEETPSNRCAAGRKRSFDDVEDCDVQDVLSQFYLPPTPRMVTSLDDDEDEDVNVVDLDTPADKRPRMDHHTAADRLRDTAPSPSYSCGHASIFNELQSVVYHSLIASLET